MILFIKTVRWIPIYMILDRLNFLFLKSFFVDRKSVIHPERFMDWLKKAALPDRFYADYPADYPLGNKQNVLNSRAGDGLMLDQMSYLRLMRTRQLSSAQRADLVLKFVSELNLGLWTKGFSTTFNSVERIYSILIFLTDPLTDPSSNVIDCCILLLTKDMRAVNSNSERFLNGNHYFRTLLARCLINSFPWVESPQVLKTDLANLRKVTVEQFKSCGMHVELSPFYHHLLTQDLLMSFYLTTNSDLKAVCKAGLFKAFNGLDFFAGQRNCLPNFNDGLPDALLHADSIASLIGAAPSQNQKLAQLTDFSRVKLGDFDVFVKSGSNGWRTQPGHVQNDNMSFEIWSKQEMVLGNDRISTYTSCRLRRYERSGRNSTAPFFLNERAVQAETWGLFRVASMSEPVRREITCYGEHEVQLKLSQRYVNMKGWGCVSVHRTIRVRSSNMVEITDETSCEGLATRLYAAENFTFRRSIADLGCCDVVSIAGVMIARIVCVEGELYLQKKPQFVAWHARKLKGVVEIRASKTQKKYRYTIEFVNS